MLWHDKRRHGLATGARLQQRGCPARNEAITTLEEAKRAAHLLLQQIEIQRQTMDLLIRMDWDSNDHLTPTSDSEQAP